MSKELNPKQYTDAIAKLQEEALQAATALLKEKGEKCYIADSKEYAIFSGEEDDIGTQSIYGVGLNEDGELCAAIGRDQYEPEDIAEDHWGNCEEEWDEEFDVDED